MSHSMGWEQRNEGSNIETVHRKFMTVGSSRQLGMEVPTKLEALEAIKGISESQGSLKKKVFWNGR